MDDRTVALARMSRQKGFRAKRGAKVAVGGHGSSAWREQLPPIFWLILIAGAVLRVAAFEPYSAHHPDETIQYLEQAHRLVFGHGWCRGNFVMTSAAG